jgi:hypothetical protein
MATWPPSLPDYVLIDGYSESPPANTIRTEMDVGPAKMRRRSTAAPRPFSITQFMNTTQLATFDTFFNTTLNSGSERFDWVHPRTQAAVEFRFVEQPNYEAIGGTSWHVSYNLEQMP